MRKEEQWNGEEEMASEKKWLDGKQVKKNKPDGSLTSSSVFCWTHCATPVRYCNIHFFFSPIHSHYLFLKKFWLGTITINIIVAEYMATIAYLIWMHKELKGRSYIFRLNAVEFLRDRKLCGYIELSSSAICSVDLSENNLIWYRSTIV